MGIQVSKCLGDSHGQDGFLAIGCDINLEPAHMQSQDKVVSKNNLVSISKNNSMYEDEREMEVKVECLEGQGANLDIADGIDKAANSSAACGRTGT